MDIKIAILYICTGKYVVFWKNFFESFEKFFLVKCEKHYYVFTDADEIYHENNCKRIYRFYQEPLPWPDITLKRFHIFSGHFERLEKYDYVFFFNSNCECKVEITETELLGNEKNIIVVQHPGAWEIRDNKKFGYERNEQSNAYIPYGKGKAYVCGGVNGGKGKEFVHLMRCLKHNIDQDLENGIIAITHDESHMNKYIIDRDDYEMLSPSYAYPEGWDLPFEEKIQIREKNNVINVDKIKGVPYSIHLKKKLYLVCKKRSPWLIKIYHLLKFGNANIGH